MLDQHCFTFIWQCSCLSSPVSVTSNQLCRAYTVGYGDKSYHFTVHYADRLLTETFGVSLPCPPWLCQVPCVLLGTPLALVNCSFCYWLDGLADLQPTEWKYCVNAVNSCSFTTYNSFSRYGYKLWWGCLHKCCVT